MFKPHNNQPRVFGVPDVRIPASVAHDMWTITDAVNTEVGWLTTARMVDERTAQGLDRYIILDEVLIPDQEVHSTTTEFTEAGMADMAIRLMNEDKANGIEDSKKWRCNNIRSWFHSHSSMDVMPSSQDETQAHDFGRKYGMPWMLRGIVNKHGKMRLDLFWFEYGFVIQDMSWEIVYTVDDARTARVKEEVSKLVRPFRTALSYSYQTQEAGQQSRWGYYGDLGG